MTNNEHALGWGEGHPQHETFRALWDELVPSAGEAETKEGEVIRAIGRLVYDWCNNGNCNAAEFLTTTCPECGGSGYKDEDFEQSDCHYCGGDCTIPDGAEMREDFGAMLEHINNCVPNIDKEVLAVKALILGDKNYNYDYDKSENAIYNAMTEKALAWVVEQKKQIAEDFEKWLNSDNVVKSAEDEYKTQCSQYTIPMTLKELKKYFRKEYAQ